MSQYLFLVSRDSVRIFNVFGRMDDPLCAELYAEMGQNTLEPGQKNFAHILRWFQTTRPPMQGAAPVAVSIFSLSHADKVAGSLSYWLQSKANFQPDAETAWQDVDLTDCLQQIFYEQEVLPCQGDGWLIGENMFCQWQENLLLPAELQTDNSEDENQVNAADVQNYIHNVMRHYAD